MSGKLKLIVLVVVAMLSFAASFFATRLVGSKAAPAQVHRPTTAPAEPQAVADNAPMGVRLKEKELDELVNELKAKMASCKQREKKVQEEEARLKLLQEDLRKQAQELEDLRVQLVSPLTRLKEAQAALDKSRIKVTAQEKENLKKTAANFEKMDPAAGGEILSNMCSGGKEDDAVRIISMLSDRSAAKLLAEMTDKTLAARLCEKLKMISQEG